MKKIALITGASTGIGRALRWIFAAHGYGLVLVARDRQRLDALAGELTERHAVPVRVIPKDLAQVTAAQELYDEIVSQGMQIEVLIRINVVCLTTLCRLFGADMVQRRSGRILNVASTAAFQAGPYMSAYYASKAYVLLLSEGLHAEMKPHGVGVTALCPGPTRTDFFERAGMVGSWLERSPFIMRAAQVAVIGAEGLMQGKPVVIPGLVNRMMAFTTRFAPRALLSAITARLNR